MLRIYFLLLAIFTTGCQVSDQSIVEDNIQLNTVESSDKISEVTVANELTILRYKVSSDTPVFSSGRTYGYLAVENNCLVIKLNLNEKPVALALPTSDNNSQWQVDWDSSRQELTFNEETFKLGQYLDIGGGGRSHDQVISNTEACKDYGVFAAFNLDISQHP